MKEILDQVLEKIRPSDNEIRKIDGIYNSLSNKVTKKGLKPLLWKVKSRFRWICITLLL